MLDFMKILMKGKPGVGKTTGYASFPGPIYVADFDGKMKVVKKHYPERDDITYDHFSAENYPAFESKWESFQDYHPYKTIVIDSLTNLANTLIRYSLNVRGADRKEDGNKKERKRGVIPLPEIEEYGVETGALNNIIDIGIASKSHFILTAHVLEIQLGKNLAGKDLGVNRVLLTAGKKIAAAIPSRFEEMWHFETDTGLTGDDECEYLIRTQSTGTDFAGTMLPLPAKFKFTGGNLYSIVTEILSEKGIKVRVEETSNSEGINPI
jgi:hypothetical protein